MLPSIRLIVATFLCSFLAVFAGLHLIALPRIATEPLPVASNAPGPDKGLGRTEGRRVEAIVPAAFELRFAPGAGLIGAVPQSLSEHANSVRAARLQPPAAAPTGDAKPVAPPKVEQVAPAVEPVIEAPAAPLLITTDVPIEPAPKPAAEEPAPAPAAATDQPAPPVAPRAAAAPEAAPAPASEPRTDVAAAPAVTPEPVDTTAMPLTPIPGNVGANDMGAGDNGIRDDPAPASQAGNPDVTATIAAKPARSVQKPRARKAARAHRPRARLAARPAIRSSARRGGIDYYSTPFGSWN